MQGEGGSGGKATPIPPKKKQGEGGGGSKAPSIAPMCPPPPKVQGGREGAVKTGAMKREHAGSGSTTYTCSWKRLIFLLVVLVLAGDRLRLLLATTVRGWTED